MMRMCNFVEEKEEEIEGRRRRRGGSLVLIVKIKTKRTLFILFYRELMRSRWQCLILLLIHRKEYKGYDAVFGAL